MFVRYVAGYPIGTIAICGMVGEMCAILVANLFEKKLRISAKDFEGRDHSRRIEELKNAGVIGADQKKWFSDLAAIRKKYLHYFTKPLDRIDADAIQAFQQACRIIVWIMDLKPENGRIKMRPEFVAYLRKEGLLGDSVA